MPLLLPLSFPPALQAVLRVLRVRVEDARSGVPVPEGGQVHPGPTSLITPRRVPAWRVEEGAAEEKGGPRVPGPHTELGEEPLGSAQGPACPLHSSLGPAVSRAPF